MARTRGAQSSSPSSRKRAAPQTPVQGSTSKPPGPPHVPPPIEGAPMSPSPEEPSSEPQPPQPPPTDSQIPSGMAPEPQLQGLLPSAPEVSYGTTAYSRDFFYPRVAMDFYQSMTTHHVRDPTVIHFTIDGRHGILGARHIAEALCIPYDPARPEDYRVWTNPSPSNIVRILSRGASTGHTGAEARSFAGALYRISEGFFFGPHHLIMAALLYFEEKVHQKKLLRADAIPQLFPRLLCQILEHLGAEPGATAGVEHPGIPHAEQPQEPQPIETPADTRAPAPAVPSAEPIPEALTTSQSILTQEMTALRAHQEQIIATQTQHSAILRQIQSHLGIPSAPQHQMPAPLEPTEPTLGDTQTST
ncbi:hypothetical protein CK203_108637 [Vitis vinifera]|uniref:Uncharacterized protein n=1 Tax=Vitis vinifera TaxID=29760 RepID=A0A438BP77_VITVI|nr:hypothetical protein CK203_108637 [Vitis vinifera]